MDSKFFRLTAIDFLKGALVSALTAGLTAVSQQLDIGHIPTSSEWKVIAISSVGAFAAYMLKNLFTNSDGKIAQGERK